MTAEDVWALPRVGAPQPSPDGRWALVPVANTELEKNESRTTIHLVDLQGDTPPRALTSPTLSAGEPRWAPDGRSFTFLRKDADGRMQLHLLSLDGGEPRVLTTLPLGVSDAQWLPDGSGLVLAAQLFAGHLTPELTKTELERRAKDPVKVHVTEERVYRYWDTWLTTGEVMHLFHLELANGALRDLTPEATWRFDGMDPTGQFDISPDGREIAFTAVVFDSERSLMLARAHLVASAGGAATRLVPDHGSDDFRPRYSPDGRSIVYGRTEDPLFYADRTRLMRYDRATKAHTGLFTDWVDSPVGWVFADDGTLVFTAEHHARVQLFTWSGTGEPRAIVSDGAAGALSATRGGRLVFTHQSIVAPSEVHVCALDGAEHRAVTRFTAEVTARYATGEVREIIFSGADEVPVQMFVVLPPGETGARPLPLVHMVHGGPHGIFGDQWHARWNAHLFAAPGYVAALVNFQGSTSWGQEFAQCIQGEWARRPHEDVMRATDLLIATGIADPKRMAATGGSYGGYMATWIAGHTDRFRCIICHAGVNDLTGQYASDVTQGRGRAAGGEAWEDIERQDLWSPIRYASTLNTPMLVTHGERDYRVPVGQGLLLYGLLKAKGVPARLVYFPDENHWVLKPQNSLLWYREVQAWLARWLG